MSFFEWHPWLYLFFIPAISMRLWAEEKKSGTLEYLITLPISISSAVLGKFIAAWVFTIISLFLTFHGVYKVEKHFLDVDFFF